MSTYLGAISTLAHYYRRTGHLEGNPPEAGLAWHPGFKIMSSIELMSRINSRPAHKLLARLRLSQFDWDSNQPLQNGLTPSNFELVEINPF
jgi:hypothetical protein